MNAAVNRSPIIFTLHRQNHPEHGIVGHEPAVVRQQLEFIMRRGYRATTMDVVDAWLKGEDLDTTNLVVFSFDDGYWDQSELIGDVFLPLGIPATMFLITDLVDGKSWPWDARIKWLIHNAQLGPERTTIQSAGLEIYLEPNQAQLRRAANVFIAGVKNRPPNEIEAAVSELSVALNVEVPRDPPDCYRPITWSEARRLEASGVRFGSHSLSHHVLTTLSQVQAELQITDSFRRLQTELTSPLSAFSYPFGNRSDFSGRDLLLLTKAGYTSAVTMTPGVVERGAETLPHRSLSINRYSMPHDLKDFIQYVSWMERVKDGLRQVSLGALVRNRYGSRRGLLRHTWIHGSRRLSKAPTPRIDWSKVRRLVFVCKGNVCRSPFAEAVARKYGLPAISLGLDTRQGTRADAVISRIALEMTIDLSGHQSRLLTPDLLEDGDLLLGMEPAHLDDERYSDVVAETQMSLLGLVGPTSRTHYIHDPYGLSDAYSRRCLRLIHNAVESLSLHWQRTSIVPRIEHW